MLLHCSMHESDHKGESFTHLRVGDFYVRYRVDDLDYEYVDSRFVILADTIIDKSRAEQFDAAAHEIARCLASDSPLPKTLSAFFLIVLDKQAGAVRLLRDPTGIKTGYYCLADESLFAGSCVHEVALAAGVTDFNEEAVCQLLYIQYLFDGSTYYQSVHEVRMGNRLCLDSHLQMTLERDDCIALASHDNTYDFESNQRFLREKIIEAHNEYLSNENVVLLSGGLDSAVMLSSLHELVTTETFRAVAFKVKDTTEDETEYAVSIAEHLSTPIEIITVDPDDPHLLDDFESKVLRMNNPYYGMTVFGKIPKPTPTQTYYAGQDTRLHTPDINPIDKLAFRLFVAARRPLTRILVNVIGVVSQVMRPFGSAGSAKKWRRAITMFCDVFNTKQYILRYFFGLDKASLRSMGVPLHMWDRIQELLTVDLETIQNTRQLYNEIVKIKYREQYTDQIRYIQSLARVCGTYIALPFHNVSLAEYCSSIPFDQATRFSVGQERYSSSKTIVNKLILRRAFRDKLNDKVYYRKKAVSGSLHLLFNGVLGTHIGDIIQRDMNASRSFVGNYGLKELVEPFLAGRAWMPEDADYLYRIYYIAMFCIWEERVLDRNKQADQQRSNRAG